MSGNDDASWLRGMLAVEDGESLPGQPVTSHRRGHWFKSNTAHHSITSK